MNYTIGCSPEAEQVGFMLHYLRQVFNTCTNVQYTGREWRRILEYYRARVNTIPSGNKPAAYYEWQQSPDHLIKAPSL